MPCVSPPGPTTDPNSQHLAVDDHDNFEDIFEGNFDDNFGIRAEIRRKF